MIATCSLNEHELLQCALVGAQRTVWAACHRLAGRYGAAEAGARWESDINGCIGEYALAKFLGLFWDGKVGDTTKPDVGDCYDARATTYSEGHLLLHPEDKDDRLFTLAIVRPPTVRLVGWLPGAVGKLPEYWRDMDYGRSAFFVPQRVLRDMSALRDLATGDLTRPSETKNASRETDARA